MDRETLPGAWECDVCGETGPGRVGVEIPCGRCRRVHLFCLCPECLDFAESGFVCERCVRPRKSEAAVGALFRILYFARAARWRRADGHATLALPPLAFTPRNINAAGDG